MRRHVGWTTLVAMALALAGCSSGGASGSPTDARPSQTATVTPATESPSASPTAAPLTGTVLFALEFGIDGADGSQLMTVHPDGTGLTELTQLDLGFASNPAWSADHASVLFDLSDGNYSHIYSMPANGGQPTQLTFGDVADRDATGSSDGVHVAFARADPVNKPMSIYVMNADGSDLTRITTGTGSDGDWALSFSPDGRTIAFSRDGALCVINIDGTGFKELVGADAGVYRPRWAPDGQHILYADTSTDPWILRIYSLAEGKPVSLHNAMGDASYSPDGLLIVGNYWRQGLHSVGLATMTLDGSTPTVFWHPEENKDIFPNFPNWIDG